MGAVVISVMVAALTVALGVRAQSADVPRCERFGADSRARAAAVHGTGQRVVVIGDSWSAGLGLDRATNSWPSRLPGAVHVAGFSGSGFSAHASTCARVAFADRAPRAMRRGADLVIVEGGLNDYDQPDADIRSGFARLMRELHGQRVVVVGPATAPRPAPYPTSTPCWPRCPSGTTCRTCAPAGWTCRTSTTTSTSPPPATPSSATTSPVSSPYSLAEPPGG